MECIKSKPPKKTDERCYIWRHDLQNLTRIWVTSFHSAVTVNLFEITGFILMWLYHVYKGGLGPQDGQCPRPSEEKNWLMIVALSLLCTNLHQASLAVARAPGRAGFFTGHACVLFLVLTERITLSWNEDSSSYSCREPFSKPFFSMFIFL